MRDALIQNLVVTTTCESSIALASFMALMFLTIVKTLCETKMGAQSKTDALENKLFLTTGSAILGTTVGSEG